MKYENIGKSSTKISKICLGCMSFGSKLGWMIETEEVKPIINRALDLGITFFEKIWGSPLSAPSKRVPPLQKTNISLLQFYND